MIKKVEYPAFTFKGITANHRAYPLDANLRVFGADTETCAGSPMTLQVSDGASELYEYVTEDSVFKSFRDWVFPRCRSNGVNICYFHFLRFDLPVLFFKKRLEMYEQGNEIKFKLEGCAVDMLFGKVNKATIEYKGKTLHVLDSWAFTQAGLDASLKMYKIPFAKREKPAGLGHIRYDSLCVKPELKAEFDAYAQADGRAEQALGREIMRYHERYKVRPSISLPQFAARVFRHHFFKKDEIIPVPPPQAVEGSQLSYHGGKNGYYFDRPTVVEDAYEIDISSAYPHAMATLPQFMKGCYARVGDYSPSEAAVYRVSGYQDVKYPIVFTDDFTPVRGAFDGLWITGHEYARALKAGMDIRITDGWAWLQDVGYDHNPMREYVEHFYKQKEATPKTSADYYFFKTCMNALYGKFCAAVEVRKLERYKAELSDGTQARKAAPSDYQWDAVLGSLVKTSSTYRAGMLTNFFIASQITGFVRGYLWDLETEHGAFHSATDAIKTTQHVKPVKGLGGLKVETFGRCYAFRNKLYLHFARDFNYCGHDPKKKNDEGKLVNAWRYELHDRGQHLCKFGLHGFKGKARDLYEARYALMRGESCEYEYGHMVGLREGFKRKEGPCSWVQRKEVLTLGKKLRISARVAAAAEKSLSGRRCAPSMAGA